MRVKVKGSGSFDMSPYAIPGILWEGYEVITPNNKRKAMKSSDIMGFICEHFKIPETNITGKSRSRDTYSWPRKIYFYLARKYTYDSLLSLGISCGNRHHSTVIHAIKSVFDAEECSVNFPDELWIIVQEVETKMVERFQCRVCRVNSEMTNSREF